MNDTVTIITSATNNQIVKSFGGAEANLKHGRQTKDKLAAQRHAAKAGRRVMGELKRLEQQIVDTGLMPDE